MKKLQLVLLLMIFSVCLFAQKSGNKWPQMDRFHELMSASFHPAEDNNLTPLKQKADSLYFAAKAWQESAIPASYKPAETKAALKDLLKQCHHIRMAVREKMSNDHLKKIITAAHDTFHKIVGECRKPD